MPTYRVTDPTSGKTVRLTGDSPPTEQELEQVFSTLQPTSAEQPIAQQQPTAQTEVPEWGRKYPNLYGVAGASRETLGPIIEALGVAGGGIAGTAGAGPAGGVAGAGLGYAGAKNLLESIDVALGNKQGSTLKQQVQQLPGEIATGAAMETGGPIIAKAASPVIKAIGTGAKQALGATTGAGPGAMEQAVKGGKAFTAAMRGKVSGDEIVDNVKGALQALKEQRGAAYREQLAKVSENTEAISGLPFKNKITELLYNYGVRPGKGGKLDFSRSVFGKSASKDVAEITNMVRDWGSKKNDNTPIMLDTLKRRLDDFYSDSSQARQFVTVLRNEVKDAIVSKVPDYAKMTKGYAEATNLIKDVETTLMAGKGYKPDQVLRRLTSSMRENFELRKELVDILGEKTGQDLAGQIAGYSANSMIPRGLVGKLAGGGMGTLVYLNPKFWPILSASSPRAVGEFLNVYGKGLVEAKRIAPATYRTMAFGAGKSTEETPNE